MNKNKEILDSLYNKFQYSELTNKDLKTSFLLGQLVILKELKEKAIGHDVNGIFQSIISEKHLTEVIKEVTSEFTKAANKSGISPDFKQLG